jgi:hypothetical protein
MTAKDKANELIQKYNELPEECDCNEYMCICFRMGDYYAKKCALISVEQVRFFHDSLFYLTKGSLLDQYLDDVKREIENL